MGFYDNISNINRSGFQFDKTYSNRYEMDSSANSDGIFVGRYVLVDYEYTADNVSSLPYYVYHMSALYPTRCFGYRAKIEKEDGTLADLVDPYGNMLFFAGLNLEHPFTLSETGANHGDTITEDTFVYVLGYFTIVERKEYLEVDTKTFPAYLRAKYQVTDADVVRYSDTELKKIYKAILVERNKQELDPETMEYVPVEGEDGKPVKINVLDFEFLTVDIPEPTSAEKEIAYNFQNNYRIDSIAYGSYGRGWDSTVWQKVYKDGAYSYKMIAELNSVVPTFDLTIDPNTLPPIAPYFDTDNTNLYYNLHIQPSWNFRVRKSESGASDVTNPTVGYESDEADTMYYVYKWNPTDVYKEGDIVEIGWMENKEKKRYFKSKVEGNQNHKPSGDDEDPYWRPISKEENEIPLAIYYNKSGFDKYQYSFSNRDDEISVTPTGIGYRNLLTVEGESRNPDTMELVMMLPSIGNAISNMWDVVYGKPVADNNGNFENKDNKRVNNLDNRKPLWDRNGTDKNKLFPTTEEKVGLRNTNIAWNSYNGIRPLQYDGTYDYSTLKTLASVINYSHDLMGMIIRNNGNLEKVADWDPTKIYEVNGRFYRKGKKYDYGDENDNITSENIESTLENFEEFTPVELFDTQEVYHKSEEERKDEDYYFIKVAEQLEQYDEPDDEDISEAMSNKSYWNYIKVREGADPIDGGLYGHLIGMDQIEYKNDWELSGKYAPNIYHVHLTPKNSSVTQEQFQVCEDFKPSVNKDYYDLRKDGSIKLVNKDSIFYDSNAYYAGLKQNPTDWGNKYYFVTSDFDLFVSCSKFPTLSDFEKYVNTLGSGYQYRFFNKSDIVVDYSSTSFIEDKDRPITKIVIGDISLDHEDFVSEDDIHYWAKKYVFGDIEYTERIPANFAYKEGDTYLNYSAYTYAIEQPEDMEETLGPLDGFTLEEIVKNGYTPIFEDTTPVQPKRIYELIPTSGRAEYNLIANSQPVVLADIDGLYYRDLSDEHYREKDPSEWYDSGNNVWKYNVTLFKEDISAFLRNYKIEGNQYYDRYKFDCYYIITYDKDHPKTYFYNLYDKENMKGYYFEDGGDYIRETVSKTNLPSSKTDYYFKETEFKDKSLWQPEERSPFIPFKYYVKNEEHGEYVLASEFNASETYYKRNAICVKESDTNIFPVGTVWNKEVTVLPPNVVLGRRNEKWGAIEIPEFGKNLGTIHGSILKASEMMLYGDKDTRDTSTIQGSINTVNDVIHRFHTLTPGEQVMVDVYGRIHSGDYDTRQSGSFINVGTSETGTISEAENRWIKYTSDSNYNNTLKPHFKLEHQLAYTTPDTITAANKNLDAVNQGDGLNASAGDTIDLYTPIVDSQGHIIGKNTETVTLPYGFKTITTNGRVSNNNVEPLAVQADLVAENTQDILAINSGNEWIKIETAPLTDVIIISHDVKNTSSTTSALDLSNENDGTTTFDIPTYAFDATNHYSSHDIKTLTMPNSYGKFTGDNGVGSEATSTHDTFSLTGDSWIQTTATKDKIAFTHIGPVETAHTAVANETPAFGSTFTITDWTFDAKGHKANSGTHTVMIPQGSLTVTENTDGAKVLTSIGFTPTTGAIVSTNKNVGTLPITDYSSLSSISSMPVATDSINTAIGKLAYVLDNDTTQVNTRITNAINGLDSNYIAGGASAESGITSDSTVNVISKIDIVDGKIATGTSESILVDKAGAAAAAKSELIGNINDSEADNTIYGAKAFAKNYVETATFTYTPKVTNPDYDAEDPSSEEFIDGTPITKTIEEWIVYIMEKIDKE